jgi:prefoldin subunit 5
MTGFSVESLENGIESCKKNIRVFEDAIEKERATIKEYREMMETIGEQERAAKQRDEMSKNFEVVREVDPMMNRGN